MELNSNYRALRSVRLPYRERQVHMAEFDLSAPEMPRGFEDYLEPVAVLCKSAGYSRGEAYLTVDERLVKAGETQRKPHPHIDGAWNPALLAWTEPGRPGWIYDERMPLITVSSIAGCQAWRGKFEGTPNEGGDCSHIELGAGETLQANVGYLLSADCIHESLPLKASTPRTFLRITLPPHPSQEK